MLCSGPRHFCSMVPKTEHSLSLTSVKRIGKITWFVGHVMLYLYIKIACFFCGVVIHVDFNMNWVSNDPQAIVE